MTYVGLILTSLAATILSGFFMIAGNDRLGMWLIVTACYLALIARQEQAGVK